MSKIVNSIADRVAALRGSIDMDTDPADVLDWALAAIEGRDEEDAVEESAVEAGMVEETVPTPEPPPIAPTWAATGCDEFGPWAEMSTHTIGARMRFRWCPPGAFLMGSPVTEASRCDDEGPRHEVTLTQGFWIADAPVVREQWPAAYTPPERGLPVINVTWHEAIAFAEQHGCRLPTEAEWECACRAGTTDARYHENVDEIAWTTRNTPHVQYVKQKRPNAWGLFDMLGNVWEWCRDTVVPRENYPKGPRVDPVERTGPRCACRGGSWDFSPQLARAAYRGTSLPGSRWRDAGFRLVRDAPAPTWGPPVKEEAPPEPVEEPIEAPVKEEAPTPAPTPALRDASITSPLQRHIAHHNGAARCGCNDPGGDPPCAFCMIALETEAAAYLRDGERAVNGLHDIADDLFHLTDDDLRRELARRAEARYANALSDAAAEIRIREQALADAREKMRALIATGKV
jgi:formylglycine-generating enzyme required for sulfatase activity